MSWRRSRAVGPEEYMEPRCPLDCGAASGKAAQSIPQRRVLEKLDEYLSRRDYSGAERHLLYWQEEARQGNDLQGQLLICNELVGHYRKNGERAKAFAAGDEAIRLMNALGFTDNLSAGTTYVNIATAYSAFDENERSLELFQRARSIYESNEGIDPELLGGLYNNMGLTFAALGRSAEARELYTLAMNKMRMVRGSELEQAITCLNMADALDAEPDTAGKPGELSGLIEEAGQLILYGNVKRDGYFAFVCEKCAPGFRYYGDENTAKQLERLAKQIYERT